jgi:polyphosphate kinase 2 (PPK2 family)
VDNVALKHWDAYRRFRDEMFRRTHSPQSAWYIVRANDKHEARLNLIRHLLAQLEYRGKQQRLLAFDPEIVFP